MNISDPIGSAVSEYYTLGKPSNLIVHSNLCDDDEMPVSYLFRTYSEMPQLEQTALNLCKGSILDIGSCAGAHSYFLQQQGFDITALEQSELCIDVLQKRGIRKTLHQDFYSPIAHKYDTLLLLMNGIGLAGKLSHVPHFFKQLKKILNPNGQILIDSSDLIYLYENEDGSVDIQLNGEYYGEMQYQFEYNKKKGVWFPWLYLDKALFTTLATQHGFIVEIIEDGPHYDYLARLTLNNN